MTQIPKIYRKFIPQLLHMIVLPLFFFFFMLVYRPFSVSSFIGREWLSVHLTIISCILLLCIGATRILYYFTPLKLNYTLYALWCIGEILFASFFMALYLWLVQHKSHQYFEVVGECFQYAGMTLVIPYSIIALSLRIMQFKMSAEQLSDDAAPRMRFYDHKHNLKLVLTPSSILYIAAEENYVNIFYTDNGKVRTYVLRSSMRAIDELCVENGMCRCHRSFYINPLHVKVLRKDAEGIIYAELDASDVRHIPVSKKYYERLTELLY